MVQRVHGPQQRKLMLRAVEQIFHAVHGYQIGHGPHQQTPATAGQYDRAPTNSIDRQYGDARDEWRQQALEE